MNNYELPEEEKQRLFKLNRVTHAAWHEFTYPRPAHVDPTDAFRRAVKVAIQEWENEQ